jgi:tRNA-specific 2-thiouridylase
MNKVKRVVVAMSGGVDSSVAAALLKRQGYEVIGITMCFNLPESGSKKPICCSLESIEDARRVAQKIGIRHYVLNMQKQLQEFVIDDFCKEYLRGATPNPCVRCNQYLKFGVLLKKALSLGAEYLATGHYAKIVTGHRLPVTGQEHMLKKAKDKKKDQSYFLYRLNQYQLRHALFPVGNYTKEEVRRLAKEFNLPVAEKLGSQEICFIPNANYREFLEHRLHRLKDTDYLPAGKAGTDLKPGPAVDKEGNILGEHKGIAYYTIGQREGLGIARGYPVYVIKIDPKNNKIIVGPRQEAMGKEFLVRALHFVSGSGLKKKVALRVRIRYNHKEKLAKVSPQGKYLKVCFQKPQFAITPGQAAVFYDKDVVLGGGIIDRVIE